MTVTLYRSGSIYTSAAPRASAMLVNAEAGEIAWIGTDEAAGRLGWPDRTIDLDGMLLAPAFVDAWAPSAAPAARRVAAAAGVGSLHLLALPESGQETGADVDVVRVAASAAEMLEPAVLAERYEFATQRGEQVTVTVRTQDDLRQVVTAAARAAASTGAARFGATRHRMHVGGELVEAEVDAVTSLGLVVVLASSASAPLRALAASGVPFAFGTGTGTGTRTAGDDALAADALGADPVGGAAGGRDGYAPDPWHWVRQASRGADAVSARAAFAAATRGGHRAARSDLGGVLRPGAPASFAVWEADGDLVVRTPDERLAAWSTDPRAATPGLPDLDRGSLPRCRRTEVRGRVVHDDGLG